MDTHVRDNLNAIVPVGTLILRVAAYTTVETAVESRWLQCNGVAVSRTTYATLFNYFNSMSPALPFGNGDGATTFNLPDLRGRAAFAEGSHTDMTLGDNDGAAEANRRSKHYHLYYSGGNSVGGTVLGSNFWDSATDHSYPSSPGSTNNIQDTPAFLVVGSYFVKYTS